MKVIGVITALDAERGQLEKILEKPLKTDLYGRISVSTYNYNGLTVCLAKSGVGEIHAAACTQLLISLYGVELIFNYGFAGGLGGAYKIGESVVVDGVVHYDFDTSAIDGTDPGRYLFYPSAIIPTDDGLKEFALSVLGSAKKGICASGDKFVADEGLKSKLYTTYGATLCDMESAAIAMIGENAKIPVLSIKVVSDSGDTDEYVSFKELLLSAKASFVEFLKNILDHLC